MDLTALVFCSVQVAPKKLAIHLMPDLTKSVIDNLSVSNREVLDEILRAKGISYDAGSGIPNIEAIADFVIESHIDTQEETHALTYTSYL